MLHSPLLISPSSDFWPRVAHALLTSNLLSPTIGSERQYDFSALRVVVPTFSHAGLLKTALAKQVNGAFIPPRITTLSTWITLLPPATTLVTESERLLSLYTGLRQHAWLKKLFDARRNTDLLPLAETLLALSDELTQRFLPSLQLTPDVAEERWAAALAQLSPSASELLSDEAQLIWSIWKSQLDSNDTQAVRFAQMMRLAERAEGPLMWVTPIEPDAFEQAFLEEYAKQQTVLPVMLDWHPAGVDAAYARAWPELPGDTVIPDDREIITPDNVSLCSATNLEQEALYGAQTIIDWLTAGKSSVAIIAQDRIVARRIRALLERAQVFVTDETGWKLSTTRAAATIAAWFEVVAARAETTALLDLLKSPFLFADLSDKTARVMAIETILRSANILSGWDAVIAASGRMPLAQEMVLQIAGQAKLFSGQKNLSAWSAATISAFGTLGIQAALMEDAAGLQVITLLEKIGLECAELTQSFSFAEWRAFVRLQLEAAPFVSLNSDNRVVMLPLNGAHLRSFEAVLMVGVDARHLPSQPPETLFFANAVRRELGLPTRESRQRQQLRDFTELLSSNHQVVLSWQACKNGEANPVSVWIERLQLALARSGIATVPMHQVDIPSRQLTPLLPAMPVPVAPQLSLHKLSASGYNSFVACPYQFFVTRMLGLSGLDELSDMPEKRDYGDWLHKILAIYHETLRDKKTNIASRLPLLKAISEKIFGEALDKNAAVLGYYARWQKIIPAYLAWANEREAQGWRFDTSERWFEKRLEWPGGDILLYGRIDRIDRNDVGECAVLDYKTSNVQSLRDKLKHTEDHQLAFYGLLSDVPVTSAHYVALDPIKDKMGDIEAPHYAAWQHALRTQIISNMQAISQGAALPASGIESVCQYCEVRGLCRKGAW